MNKELHEIEIELLADTNRNIYAKTIVQTKEQNPWPEDIMTIEHEHLCDPSIFSRNDSHRPKALTLPLLPHVTNLPPLAAPPPERHRVPAVYVTRHHSPHRGVAVVPAHHPELILPPIPRPVRDEPHAPGPVPGHRRGDAPRASCGVVQLDAAGAAAVGGERRVPGATSGHDDSAAGRGGAGEAPSRDAHVGEALPAVAGEGEVEPVGGGGGGGVVEGIAPGVEAGAAEDVDLAADRDRGEVGEAVVLRRARDRREGPPGGGRGGVEQYRGGEGGVGGEEEQEVATRRPQAAAEREEVGRRGGGGGGAGGGPESGLVGEREQAEDDGGHVVRQPRDNRRHARPQA